MAENIALEKLAASLTLEERKELLRKINSQLKKSKGPLSAEAEELVSYSIENLYDTLPWFIRLFYFIMSLFKDTVPIKAYENRLIAKVGREIEERTPGLYDYDEGLLLPNFYQALSDLKDSARFFYNVLDLSVNRDRGAFFAFLGSLEMESIHRQLCAVTDPDTIAAVHPFITENDLRQTIQKALDNAFAAITEQQRENMYHNARSLHCLKELSFFLFDRILLSFVHNNEIDGMVCKAHLVREHLMDLNDILNSFSEFPSPPLLESLFVFAFQDRSRENMETEIKEFISDAENSLEFVREFNRRISLTRIIRCTARDMTILPSLVSGGEDWYNLYREYWKRSAEEKLVDFSRRFRRKELMDAINEFLKGGSFRTLANTATEHNSEGIPLRGGLNLAFLGAFYHSIFHLEINKILSPIMTDGTFIQEEDRVEFSEHYNTLFRLGDTIGRFEALISAKGDLGKRFEMAKQDMNGLAVRRRRLQVVSEEAADKAKIIITQARNSIFSLMDMLNVISNKVPPSNYFGITNFNELVKKNNGLPEGINAGIMKLKEVLRIMETIDAMDDGRPL
jgi:hypothetical protein